MTDPEVEAVARAEHPLDGCVCGDYRRDHPNNGPCNFNVYKSDMTHGFKDCHKFELDRPHVPALDDARRKETK